MLTEVAGSLTLHLHRGSAAPNDNSGRLVTVFGEGEIRFKLFIIYSHGDVTLLEW